MINLLNTLKLLLSLHQLRRVMCFPRRASGQAVRCVLHASFIPTGRADRVKPYQAAAAIGLHPYNRPHFLENKCIYKIFFRPVFSRRGLPKKHLKNGGRSAPKCTPAPISHKKRQISLAPPSKSGIIGKYDKILLPH